MNSGREQTIETIRQRLRKHREYLQRKLGVTWPDDSGESGSLQTHNDLMDVVTLREFRTTEDALQRIREGSYGFCTRCCGEIAAERLELIPFASVCIPCQMQENRTPDQWS